MNHILELDASGLRVLHEEIFPKIVDRETILFLGAGVSVTDEKKFLSRDIIDLYETKKNIDTGITDIVKFVDVLSESDWFDRSDFDREVYDYLSRLNPTETHRIIAGIHWKEIITTNFDLLIERAAFEVERTSDRGARIKPTRSVKEYRGWQANDELRYVKLHGCMSDRSEYPFVFSSEDFRSVKPFYKVVLNSLKSLSHKIQFISFGYSFSDSFAERLWAEFDKYSDIKNRWIWSVDPFVKDTSLPYLTSNRTRVIKLTAAEFFSAYKEWAEVSAGALANRYHYNYRDRDDNEIRISNSLRLRLGESLQELSPKNSGPRVRAEDYYRGDKPTFDVITQGLDVIRTKVIETVKREVKKALMPDVSNTIPIVFLEGSFGAGKTTFAYRLAEVLRDDEGLKAVCFDVVNPLKVRAPDLVELFEKTAAQIIVLLANDIEPSSLFQAVNDLRYQLSVEQFYNFKVVIIASIRENILHKYQRDRRLKNATEIHVDAPLTQEEVKELVNKLRAVGLVKYRTESELNRMTQQRHEGLR